jgi:hypothetical protein
LAVHWRWVIGNQDGREEAGAAVLALGYDRSCKLPLKTSREIRGLGENRTEGR